MKHVIEIVDLGDGYFWLCACGERPDALSAHQWEATSGGDRHLADISLDRHRLPTPRPSTKTLIRHFRERAEWPTYTPGERAEWKRLADELEQRQKTTSDDSQEAMFE